MARNNGIEFHLEGERELYIKMQRRMDLCTNAGREALQNAGLLVVAKAKDNLKANGSIASGNLRSSGRVQKVAGDADAIDAGFFGQGSEGGYAFFVEYGRRAGKMPPPDELIEWVRKKNMKNTALSSALVHVNGRRRKRKKAYTLNDLLTSAAWGLAKNIAKDGTKPHPFFKPALEATKGKVRQLLKRAIKKETDRNE